MDKPVIDGQATQSEPPKDPTPVSPPDTGSVGAAPGFAWWLVLGLVGLDYFSTLAYLPSIRVDDVVFGFAPLIAVLVAILTLFVALPIYLYLAGRSPHGLGVAGLLESHLLGRGGKLFLLLLLGFMAADFVLTRTLSAASAATHLIGNAHWQSHAGWMTQARDSLHASLPASLQGPTADTVFDWCNEQVIVTVILSLLAFGLYFFVVRGFTRNFLYVVGVLVALFLVLNGIVIVSSVLYLAQHPEYIRNWKVYHDIASDSEPVSLVAALTLNSFLSDPSALSLLAVGMSGFELSLVSIGLVRGRPGDGPARPRGRIRHARKLLATAACLMSLLVLGSVLSVNLLVPIKAMTGEGEARNRALAYLAHGGTLSPPAHDPNSPPGERPEDLDDQAEAADDARNDAAKQPPATAADLNPLFGPAFGTLYDVSTILVLFLAGASVTLGLRNLLPQYLDLPEEEQLGRRRGFFPHLFNLIILLVILYFHASVPHQLGAYSVTVSVLLAAAAFAAVVDLRSRWKHSMLLPLATVPLLLVCGIFLLLAGLVIWQSPSTALLLLLFIVLAFVLAGLAGRMGGTTT
jgi:hypothetical protein